MRSAQAFARMIRIVGSVAELTRRINERLGAEEAISVQAVWKWESQIPASRCILLEEILGGKVTRHQMRPDVFGIERHGSDA